MRAKSETADTVVNFLHDMEVRHQVKFKTIRCDGAGENKALKNKCFEEKMGITFEFTAPDTPQHNGMIERSFATSYGRMRAMFQA